MDKAHTHTIRVYIEDTDAGGIVYHANYLKFTERARTEWIRTLGYGKNFIETYGLLFVVHNVQFTFRVPAVLDDLLTVKTQPLRIAKSYIDLMQNIYRGDNTLVTESHVRITSIDQNSRRPTRIPKHLYNLLTQE